jgi:RNA ligase (TIGR02306 family)
MAGVLSQGICFPLSILPLGVEVVEGDDVTDVLGITKWERPDATDLGNNQEKKPTKKFPKWLMRYKWFRQLVYKFVDHRSGKAFPDFLSKTDETRIQNAPWYLDSDAEWVLTEKVDGQSGSFAVKKTHKWFGRKYESFICSRNLRLFGDDGSSYWKVWKKYGLEKKLIEICECMGGCEWVAIQGEIIGPKIQGNKYHRTEPELYVFNLITDRDGRFGSYVGRELLSTYDLNWVPIIGTSPLPKTVEEMLEMAHGTSWLADILREGLVCRSVDGKQSFKAVDPEFLIKYGE